MARPRFLVLAGNTAELLIGADIFGPRISSIFRRFPPTYLYTRTTFIPVLLFL